MTRVARLAAAFAFAAAELDVPNLLGWKKERVHARTTELLELVGLDPELGGRFPAHLHCEQPPKVRFRGCHDFLLRNIAGDHRKHASPRSVG